MLGLNNFSIFCSSKRNLSRWLHYCFQTILILIIVTAMIIWGIILLYVFHSIPWSVTGQPVKDQLPSPRQNSTMSTTPTSISSTVSTTLEDTTSGSSPSGFPTITLRLNPSTVKVFLITNLCIPELFALVAVLAVSSRHLYWCSLSAIALFVCWLLDHQRYPTLYAMRISNSIQALFVTAHALHLLIWILLFLYGGFLSTGLGIKVTRLKQFMDNQKQISFHLASNEPYFGNFGRQHFTNELPTYSQSKQNGSSVLAAAELANLHGTPVQAAGLPNSLHVK